MTIVASKIRGYVAGDALTIKRIVQNVPIGDILSKAWLTIKANKTDADVDAALQIEVDAVADPSGYITDTGVDGTGKVEFTLTATQTTTLGYATTYYYDIQVLLASGKPDTVEIGTIRLRQGFTDATS